MDTETVLEKLCERPKGLTVVRRDGKDDDAVIKIIKEEYERCQDMSISDEERQSQCQNYASACWVCIILLEDENKQR